MKNSKEKSIKVLIAVFLEFTILIGMLKFQQTFLRSFPLAVRAVLIIVCQWLLLPVPVCFMKKSHETLRDYGFSRNKLGVQIVTGIVIGLALSLVVTVVPIMMGFKDMVSSTSYTKTWQFCYEFIYMLIGVALVEEFFYRGFLYKRLSDINDSKWFVILTSSIIFGISHIFNGDVLQVIMTSLLGIFFCICREKIKNCTTLSLIIAHGLHNGLIVLLVAIL